MAKKSSIIIGKFVRKVARLKGGGSALPGLVIEKIDKNFVSDHLSNLKHGVIIVTGTNGKTTTTKITVELLESQGLKVFTNRTGSNFTRGVIAAILESIDKKGKLNADIAVLELDEAYAVKFSEIIPPNHALLLNVMRDQLDRFGEINYTASLLEKVAMNTTKSVTINREDHRLLQIHPATRLNYFGLSKSLEGEFPEDDNLLNSNKKNTDKKPNALVTLNKLNGQTAEFQIDGEFYTTYLALKGTYNAFNAAAALALTKSILPNAKNQSLISALSKIESAFGRGESFNINGSTIELLLVKNPSGFQLALKSFSSEDREVMIAINDEYADGRDVSWLWNVNFTNLKNVKQVSGTRANDMTLRLKYDDIPVESTDENLETSLKNFIKSSQPKYIFATYTAMLKIRKYLSSLTKVEDIL